MIVITGAAGFIGSCLWSKLNENNFNDIIAVDDFSDESKQSNYLDKKYSKLIPRDELDEFLKANHRFVQFVFHIGARTDTTEFNKDIFDELNVRYSQMVWKNCVEYGLPLVYASSAATYGDGENGYDDSLQDLQKLKPLNPYGISKNEFDIWAMAQKKKPYFWAGLKFFNVYGPNEYHKGRMASVIFHAFNQISEKGKMKLFRSHRDDYEDGMQLRDFIYVKDITEVCCFLLHHRKDSGIYNLGTGNARSFLDLAKATFKAMKKDPDIEFIDIPTDIRDKYQYYTQAEMQKLRNIGYEKDFCTLEEGIDEYVNRYLSKRKFC